MCKLTYNQRYSIAAMLSTNTLEATLERLERFAALSKELAADSVAFAKVADKYFQRRDGFIPKAVVDLCKQASKQEQTTPEKQLGRYFFLVRLTNGAKSLDRVAVIDATSETKAKSAFTSFMTELFWKVEYLQEVTESYNLAPHTSILVAE